jgi:putative selenate reductase FAD-binding subunit
MAMEILRPTTITEALQAGAVPGAAWLGGGTWIAARRGDQPRVLVSLERLGLDHIRCEGRSCTIGAAVTFQQVLDGPGVPEVLRQAVAGTASRTLRNMVTVGGELGLLPQSSALVPAFVALDARVTLAGRKRTLDIADYCLTRPAGLILEVTIPDGSLPCALRALARTSHSTRSLVVALAARALSPAVSGVRAVASDCRGQILRLAGFEKALEGAALPARERIEAMVRGAFSPRADMHASAPYKSCLAGVFAADILHELAAGRARR